MFTFRGHNSEGYALDWSPVVAGRLASGDGHGFIHIWNMGASSNAWQVDSTPYTGHTGSVEDLQWSPTEATVFSSSSSDKTVKIWDTRGRNGPQISIDAHNEDVNVISWNRNVAYLLASGSDDGSFKVNECYIHTLSLHFPSSFSPCVSFS
jgi:ribosome assembly protein RRB1